MRWVRYRGSNGSGGGGWEGERAESGHHESLIVEQGWGNLDKILWDSAFWI